MTSPGVSLPQPRRIAPATPSDQSQDQSITTLKVNVEVVQLFFNVKDKHGALIPNLTKDNFDVFEDGKPQTIKYFKAESDLPLTLGILIDSSGSQMRVLDMEKESWRFVPREHAAPQRRGLRHQLRRGHYPFAGFHQFGQQAQTCAQ